MHDRLALGVADVSDVALAAIVGRSLGLADGAEIELLESSARVAPYDLEALTTAGRYWVHGRARTPAGEQPFTIFVKVVQSWSRSPIFAFVPEDYRELALAFLPWRVEPLMYRSDLSARLPDGLSMPKAYAVMDLDETSAAIWLERVDQFDHGWDADRFVRAAHLLGRLAGSERVRATARTGRAEGQRLVRGYAQGRVMHQIVPALRGDDLWSHPLMAGTFDDELRADLLAAADDLDAIVDELEALPVATLHGDACTRNLLARNGTEEMVLIDLGFWGEGPVGFDLGQLLLGEVQLGERPAGCLPSLEPPCLLAYLQGLEAEGYSVQPATVRRAHALQMLLFNGLSAVPLEHLGSPPTDDLLELAGQRASAARFVLDLVRATA